MSSIPYKLVYKTIGISYLFVYFGLFRYQN